MDYRDVYLHIGNRQLLIKKDVIGVFDCDLATVASDSRSYLSQMQHDGFVISLTDELPRSFLLVCKQACPGRRGAEAGKGSVYLSQISPQALAKR